MTNAELISKIKTEIEKLKEENNNIRCDSNKAYCQGYGDAFVDLLPFIDTLESEKPMDLDEQIGSYNIVPYIDDKIAKLQDMWREEKVSFDWDDLKDMIEDVARHFAEWGYLRAAEKYDEIEYNRQREEKWASRDLKKEIETQLSIFPYTKVSPELPESRFIIIQKELFLFARHFAKWGAEHAKNEEEL